MYIVLSEEEYDELKHKNPTTDEIRLVRENQELKFEIRELKRKIAEFEFQCIQTSSNKAIVKKTAKNGGFNF